jgi:ATP-dependent Clp protease ATP-binding subunit ClpA
MTPALKAHLAEIGYDPEYGARPLKRTLQRLVLDPLARGVLEGSFPPGSVLVADWDAGASEVRFAAAAAAPAAAARRAGGGARGRKG